MKKKILSILLAGSMTLSLAACGGSGAQSPASASSPSISQEKQAETVTMGQKNALRKAKEYLAVMPFSHSGLAKQLEFEGYTSEEATYGADNCGADWNDQAAKKAKEYLDISAFSRDGLIKQLEYEGFTNAQAIHGVTANGY